MLDGGTQGLYLVQFVAEADHLLVFDAIDYGLEPGTLKLVRGDEVPKFTGVKKMSLHQTGFQEVLSAADCSADIPKFALIGCQPLDLEDWGGPLTEPVRSQIEPAIELARECCRNWGVEVADRAAGAATPACSATTSISIITSGVDGGALNTGVLGEMKKRAAFLFDDLPMRLEARVSVRLCRSDSANIAVWTWAMVAFRDYPLLLGTAALAYSFGLRHAFDADHIAAIDNVTRKLMQEGKRPVGVGLFFSLGHSTIVVALSVGIAIFSSALQDRFDAFKTYGAVAGRWSRRCSCSPSPSPTCLSSPRPGAPSHGSGRRRGRRRPRRAGRRPHGAPVPPRLPNGRESWGMYPIGLLFGLGFDTATEVGLLGISATQAAQGLPIWAILVFPALRQSRNRPVLRT